MQKHYTIMVITDQSSRVKKWTVSLRTLKAMLGVVAIMVLVSLLCAFGSYIYFRKSRDFKVAKVRLMYLESQLEHLSNKVASSEATLIRVQNFEQKLREITLAKNQSDERAMGPLSENEHALFLKNKGPMDLAYVKDVDQDEEAKKPYAFKMNSLEATVNRIGQNASLQEQSLSHLYEILRDQQSILSSTPSIMPAQGHVTSGFGFRTSPFTGERAHHAGIDISAPMGANIYAPADGVVIQVTNDEGYGKLLVIKHGYGVMTRYGHNSKIFVAVGQKVRRGQVISQVGSTGRSTAPHLHYEVVKNGVALNPSRYILD